MRIKEIFSNVKTRYLFSAIFLSVLYLLLFHVVLLNYYYATDKNLNRIAQNYNQEYLTYKVFGLADCKMKFADSEGQKYFILDKAGSVTSGEKIGRDICEMVIEYGSSMNDNPVSSIFNSIFYLIPIASLFFYLITIFVLIFSKLLHFQPIARLLKYLLIGFTLLIIFVSLSYLAISAIFILTWNGPVIL
jgi:hypothetical protein